MIFVGIPCLNRFDLLERAVASIDVPHELFLIDNSVHNRGVAASWNAIMREGFARGFEWVFCGVNDAFLGPGDLDRAIDLLGTGNAGLWKLHYYNWWAISRATVARVGWFDERFWPCYHADNDYDRRCQLAGVPIGQVPACNVEHLENSTLRAGYKMADTEPYYIEKWGGPPGQETFAVPFNIQPADARQCRRCTAAGRRK